MKALILTAYSKTPRPTLNERPDPSPRPGEILLRMKAAALNPADLHIASGEMKTFSPVKPPHGLGVDGAGEVLTEGVRFRAGDRVMFYTGLAYPGTLAEVVAVPEAWAAPVPTSWTWEEAAAAPLALLVAARTLDRAEARAGERIFITGAGGPVGAATVALALARGLQVHASGTAVDETYIRSLGVASFHDYRHPGNLPKEVEIALDALGGSAFEDCLAVIARGGRIVSLKTMTGTADMEAMGMRIPGFMRVLLPLVFAKPRKAAARKGATLIGLASVQDGGTLAQAARAAERAGHRIRIDSTFPLQRATDAFNRLSDHPRGKVIVQI